VTKLKSSLTYANVMATVAVFLALGGVATAAFTLPKKSVGPKQLKANAVTEPKIAGKAVTEGKLGDGAVTNGKLADNAVNGNKVANASIGLSKTAVIDTTVSQDFGSIAAGSCQSIGKNVPAPVQPTDLVEVTADGSLGTGDARWYAGAVTLTAGPPNVAGASQIELHVCNGTSVPSGDMPATTFRILVFR
jgi:hypothetical protein